MLGFAFGSRKGPATKTTHKDARARLRVEALEERWVPTGPPVAPAFVANSSALRLITPDRPFYFHALADDGNDDVLSYRAVRLPVGLGIDPTSGIISGTPNGLPATGETVTFTVVVTDGQGGTAQEDFTFTVTPAFTPWVINTSLDDPQGQGTASKDKDLLDGVPLDWNNQVSLRAVVEQANFNRFGGQPWSAAPIYVTFDPSTDNVATILSRPLDTIQANIVFIGRGEGLTRIAGHPAEGPGSNQGIFRFATGSTSAITDLTLESGYNTAPGGAVSVANNAGVFLDTVRLSGCEAPRGGAIHSIGYVATINSTVYANEATDAGAAASGGGIHVEGGYFVSSESTFQANTGVSKGGGIGINNTGKAFIHYTDIIGNHAQTAGGIYLSGGQRLVLHNALVLGNSTDSRGGVLIEGNASIRNTSFDWNSADIGGAIDFRAGTLTLKGCWFGDDNTATTGGPKLARQQGTTLYAEPEDNINFDPLLETYWN
jgi:hypothetical protein